MCFSHLVSCESAFKKLKCPANVPKEYLKSLKPSSLSYFCKRKYHDPMSTLFLYLLFSCFLQPILASPPFLTLLSSLHLDAPPPSGQVCIEAPSGLQASRLLLSPSILDTLANVVCLKPLFVGYCSLRHGNKTPPPGIKGPPTLFLLTSFLSSDPRCCMQSWPSLRL